MSKTNNERLQEIAEAMQELNARIVYVGGAMAGGYATDPIATAPIRMAIIACTLNLMMSTSKITSPIKADITNLVGSNITSFIIMTYYFQWILFRCQLIYPPFMGETAFSENSFSTPFLYLGSLGCQAALRSASTLFTSSGDISTPLIPTTSSMHFQ